MIKKILLFFLLWKIILFVPILIANQLISYREGYDYTSINYFLGKSQSLVSNFLLSPWANFDGVYYLLIAAIYSESLFLLLSVLSFYFARKRNWLVASIVSMLLTVTRPVGIAILPALLYEFYVSEKTLIKTKAIALFSIPLGLIGYSLYNLQRWGDAFYFIHAQENFQNNREAGSIILFPQTIFRYLKIFFTASPKQYEWFVALLEFVSFIFASVMLYIAWKMKIRLSYLIFSLIAFLIPVSTGTFSGLPRYTLPLFPIFLGLALIKRKFVKISYLVISSILLFILLMLFSKGYFVA